LSAMSGKRESSREGRVFGVAMIGLSVFEIPFALIRKLGQGLG
jgi:hypothetical protein